MDMQAVIRELQDTLTVMVEIERRQSSTLLEHRARIAAIEEETAEHYLRSATYQERTDQNLAEITDKLNGLIGYVATGSSRPSSHPEITMRATLPWPASSPPAPD